MHDQATIQVPQPQSLPHLPDTGFSALDSEARSQSYRNLRYAAYVYAGVYFAAFWSYFLADGFRNGFSWPETQYMVSTWPSIAMALVIARLVQRRTFPSHAFIRIAQTFVVLSCLGIAGTDWSWQFHSATGSFEGVHWVGVWLINFAAMVTLPPRKILVAGFLGSLTVPAILLLSAWGMGFPAEIESNGWALTGDRIVSVFVSLWISVGIAGMISGRVFHLARDASKARRLGSYRLEEKLGAGGMGEVWRASHRMLARPAAIKLIREQAIHVTAGESAGTLLRRFEREAQATAALTSPHTVQIYDFGITREGTFYYVMELLHGLDLRTLVETSGPLPPARTLHLLRQACDSLADAHAHGMVHRDVKPANLFVCRQGLTFDFLKVLDFGLVRESGDARAQLTQQGVASGTPGYMAPEVATEKQRIDGRADLYALGCVGYWLLTGSNVFTADSVLALILKHVNDTPPSMREVSELDIPEEVEALILQCLAKSPDDRPSTARELGSRIDELQTRIGNWTDEQAEDWWRLHLAHLVQLPQPLRPTTPRIEQEAE